VSPLRFRHLSLLLALASAGFAAETPAAAPAGGGPARITVDLDAGWRFSLGDYASAMQAAFDDSGWRRLNLPHDWSIEGPFTRENGSGNGFAPGGVGWYRRHFRLDPANRGRIVAAEFDGVYDNSEVWVNGFHVGGRPYGFESFACDLTPFLRWDADNVLAVRVDHSRFADSRWYTGSGIYRDVRLRLTHLLHVAPDGIYVTTPVAGPGSAAVRVQATVENGAADRRIFRLETELLAPDGSVVGHAIIPGVLEGGRTQTLAATLTVARPLLWSPEAPSLYTARLRLLAEGGAADETRTAFGIRSVVFDPERGVSLNGQPIKLKGVCLHQDGGSVGVAIPLAVWERRLGELKALGVNAIRTSHNPTAPEFLDLCDRLGFLVMDEAFDEFTPGKNKWVVGWNQGVPSRFGYSEFFAEWSVRDLSDMVRRDRNHPSIVMWSIGNEIDYPNDPFTSPALGRAYRPGNPPATDLVRWGRPLVAAVKALDTTRPVTAALASVAMSNDAGFAQILDLDGYNYQEPRYAEDSRRFPRRVIYGSENKHDYAAWAAVRDNPRIGGQFLWTGIDYLGEARAWPARASADGLLDLCGFVKPQGRFRQSLWSDRPMVYLCATKTGSPAGAASTANGLAGEESWNWPAQADLTVACCTNCPEVTLLLNGRPLGVQRLDQAQNGVLSWRVPYAPGVLQAVGRRDGKVVAEFTLQTAGPAQRIVLQPTASPWRADGRDVCQVEFDVVDAQGVRVPGAGPELAFALEGPARILGLGNGDIADHEPVTAPSHQAYQGRGLAILQSTASPGEVSLTVSGAGLAPAVVRWSTTAISSDPR
jgi:beta-galactosidase